VSSCRYEVGELHNQLEKAKTEVDAESSTSLHEIASAEVPRRKIEPYDMSVLLDENLRKERQELESKNINEDKSRNDHLPEAERKICFIL